MHRILAFMGTVDADQLFTVSSHTETEDHQMKLAKPTSKQI